MRHLLQPRVRQPEPFLQQQTLDHQHQWPMRPPPATRGGNGSIFRCARINPPVGVQILQSRSQLVEGDDGLEVDMPEFILKKGGEVIVLVTVERQAGAQTAGATESSPGC